MVNTDSRMVTASQVRPGYTIYHASGNLLPTNIHNESAMRGDSWVQQLKISDHPYLKCSAIYVGKVLKTAGRSVNGNVPREWVTLFLWTDGTESVLSTSGGHSWLIEDRMGLSHSIGERMHTTMLSLEHVKIST
jgi:hypothetical protein